MKLPNPEAIELQLARILRSEIECVQGKDALSLDTPFTLQDNSLLQVFIKRYGDEQLVLSDGGRAIRELSVRGVDVGNAENIQGVMLDIATSLGLEWDGSQFIFRTSETMDLLRHISLIGVAVDRTISLLWNRIGRAVIAPKAEAQIPMWPSGGVARYPSDLTGSRFEERFEQEFANTGLHVIPEARLIPNFQEKGFFADYLITNDGKEAAIELISAFSPLGFSRAIDRTITRFHALSRAGYRGWMVGVYNDVGLQLSRKVVESIQMFEISAPEGSSLFGMSTASTEIKERLSA